MSREGWEGWDEYAPFYDWENAQTVGRRDVAFWRRMATKVDGPVLELGCGTGRVSLPLVRAGVQLVGIDRSAAMVERARSKILKSPNPQILKSLRLVQGDIRRLPFRNAAFPLVIAPYGILQSLLDERALIETLRSVARTLEPGGTFGLDLVPDVPNWREYSNRVQFRGRAAKGVHLTLVESVRQDRRRHVTTFFQRYIERRNGRSREHRFELRFRTLSLRQLSARLERAGFTIDAVLGDYHGGAWDRRADVWIILAKKQ
jgi:ubiquinone/menaquinone biosynthesis C-methylase UbiE